MADIIGSYERLPNDAVRAVAVAKRREYMESLPPSSIGSCCAIVPQQVADHGIREELADFLEIGAVEPWS